MRQARVNHRRRSRLDTVVNYLQIARAFNFETEGTDPMINELRRAERLDTIMASSLVAIGLLAFAACILIPLYMRGWCA